LHHLLQASALAAALAAPATAAADDVVADLARDTPIAAHGGVVAWSSFDAASNRYALVLRQGDVTATARTATARRAFDVSLGPDTRGRVVALYTRCRTATRGCDVYRYDLSTRREHKLRSVSSPSFDEAWPAQWRDRVTFSRRARTRVIGTFDHRPDPRRKGPLLACDIPFVKTLSSRAPSRRLDRSQCGSTDGMAIRGDTIVHVAGVSLGGAGSESQVRRLRTRGGAAVILARTGGGEGGFSPFTSPSLSKSSVWLTRIGRRERAKQGFLRIDLRSKRLTTVASNLNLAGRVARDERGGFWYVQGPEDPDFYGVPPLCTSPLEPCRLVRASASPFSSALRALLPRVRVLADGSDGPVTFASNPVALSGDVSRAVVRGGTVVARQPVPGVVLALLLTATIDEGGPFTDTARTATTDAAGGWSFALNPPPPQAAFVVFSPVLRIASSRVGVSAVSKMGLSASGGTLTGTVAPAQPGRSVQIERFAVDAEGRLPGGEQICVKLPGGKLSCGDRAWATIGQAPLDAAGTSFSTTAPGPGAYRARLSAEPDAAGRPTAYGGLSPAVVVTG